MSMADATVPSLIIALKTLTLVLGGLITYYAYRAYRRTRSRSLGALALGFGIMTLGTLLAGIADQLFNANFQVGLLIESALLATGFGVIVYSLYTTTP
jgi:hypothetical protein